MLKLHLYFFSMVVVLLSGCASIQSNASWSSAARSMPYAIGGIRVADVADGNRILSRKIHLDASQEKVFQFLADFESMPEWMPGIKSVTVDNQHSQNGSGEIGVGSLRTCSIGPGEVKELVLHYDPPHAFAVKISEETNSAIPMSEGTGIVVVTPTNDGGCDLSYNIIYKTKPFHPMSSLMPVMMRKQLREGMDNVIQRYGGHVIE